MERKATTELIKAPKIPHSAFLAVPIATLHQWRYLGTGPAAFRVGKHLRYDPDVVRRWLVDDCSGAA